MVNGPIRYSADVEQEQDDEQATVAKLNDAFDIILERTAEDYGHAVRSVHAKSHGLLEGELTVDANLPAELAQGLFATPGVHKVLIRLSTNAGDILPDVISLPRGLAMKVFDVEGERLPGAEGSAQDFVMVNGPVFQAKTAEKFLGNLKLLARTTDRMEGTKTVASAVLRGVRHALEAVGGELPSGLNSLGGAPNSEPLGDTYYSATAFRYGDYIAKFSLAPVAPEMTALTGKEIDVDGRENAIREEVRAEVRGMDLEWEFRVQLCRDLDAQPVEDATVRWDEQDAPFLRVGMVRAAAQDSWSDDHVRRINEESRFSVWTGIAAHRPLGNINRVRKDTYRHSADFRARTNGCPYHEPVARDAGAGQG
ncbi:catalase family protein [Sphingomonas sp. PP-F2F-A104-K0414]|uniref:catalase family protein n=1 Tax=Sphingomonas sp. PP-F2F-A104-K0414 TaxID=2135661 RepID=UPI001044EF84|nr:catalase family protein [Sphingomonas sp. PP-F2F-A104-K0414]